jgi:hypothetical protein
VDICSTYLVDLAAIRLLYLVDISLTYLVDLVATKSLYMEATK